MQSSKAWKVLEKESFKVAMEEFWIFGCFYVQVNPSNVACLHILLHCSSEGHSRSSSFPLPH